jgi:hypothetical protein
MTPSTTKAAARIHAFQTRREAELLEEAADFLQAVVVSDGLYPEPRRKLRAEVLELWLRLFNAIDTTLDPHFNPDDVPYVAVMPPPDGDTRYPPGVDPAMIKDPAARTEYEHRIAQNRQKAEIYSLQIKLRRLDQRLQPRLESFVQATYDKNDGDRRELEAAIQTFIVAPARVAGLRQSLVHGRHRDKR